MTTVNRSIELTIYEETPDQSRKEMHDISVTGVNMTDSRLPTGQM